MEVNNQMMDQLLVNTAAQAPSAPNAAKPKDDQSPDFNSMVNQRRATDAKSNAKDAKAGKQPEKAEKPTTASGTQDSEPITGEQYAIAAALMMQVQPDGPRMAQIQPELIAAENTVTVEAVLLDDVEAPAEMPTQNVTAEIPLTMDAETKPETAEVPMETAAPVQQQSEPTGEVRTEHPVEAKAQPQQTEQKPGEPQVQSQQQTVREDAPRAEKAPEQPRFVRNDASVRTENDDTVTDDAQSAQATPLFRNVEAPVIKVAEASRPIPLEAEDGIEQLADEIDKIVVNDVSANRIEVTLTPENLGKLTVEITRGENGNLSIVLHTTSERAANILERHTVNLQNALTANNRSDVEVQVRPSEESERQFLNPDGQNEQNRQQQQQQHSRRQEQTSAQDFLQQLRLGLVDNEVNQ